MDEKQLIERSKQGDEDAFRELMKSHERKIFSLCFSILKDEGLAKDMTQEAFLKAYQHLKEFRLQSQFYTWVFRIARNLSLNLLKKRKVHELSINEEILPATETFQESSENKETLLEVAKSLSQEHQEVIRLFEYEKIPQKEIAARLNVPEGTVRSRIHYARKKMKECLKQRDSRD